MKDLIKKTVAVKIKEAFSVEMLVDESPVSGTVARNRRARTAFAAAR